MSAYYLSVTLHVLAALLWLGGMFFLGVVGAPALRKVEPPELRRDLFQRIGTQARRVGWIAIGVLVVTGVLNLYFRGLLRAEILGDAAFWTSGYGHSLIVKLTTVTMMLVLQAFHDFVAGPRAGRLDPGDPAAARWRRRAAWVARINVLVGVVLVLASVRLARGG